MKAEGSAHRIAPLALAQRERRVLEGRVHHAAREPSEGAAPARRAGVIGVLPRRRLEGHSAGQPARDLLDSFTGRLLARRIGIRRELDENVPRLALRGLRVIGFPFLVETAQLRFLDQDRARDVVPGKLHVLDIDLFGTREASPIRIEVLPNLALIDLDRTEAAGRKAQRRVLALLGGEAPRFAVLVLAHVDGARKRRDHFFNENVPAYLELEAQGTKSLVAQVDIVQFLGKAVLALKLRQRGDRFRQPAISDAKAVFQADLYHQLVVDHLFERLLPQSRIVDHGGGRAVAEQGEQPIALLLVEPREASSVHLHPVHRRNRHSLAGRHVVVDAPQREGDADQNDNRPRDPSRRAVTNGLEHQTLGIWRSGRDSNPRPPA